MSQRIFLRVFFPASLVAGLVTFAACGPLAPSIAKSSLQTISKGLSVRTDSTASRCSLDQSTVDTLCEVTTLKDAADAHGSMSLSANGANSRKFSTFKSRGRVVLSSADVSRMSSSQITIVHGDGAQDVEENAAAPKLKAYLVVEDEAKINSALVRIEALMQADGTCVISLPALQAPQANEPRASDAEVSMSKQALEHLKTLTIIAN